MTKTGRRYCKIVEIISSPDAYQTKNDPEMEFSYT